LKALEGLNKVKVVELDMVLGRNFLISVHEEPIPQIETAIKNITEGPPVIPQRGMDWLAYQIVDQTVDSYLPVIDLLSDRMEQLENEALEKPEPAILAQILAAKRDIVTVHRTVLPLRELVSRLGRERFEQIDSSTQSSLRDAYDHMVRVSSASEVLREVAEGALTIYAMSQNNRTNEIIKALSIAATVGLPAIIIASIYGMNFRNMPELQWRYGYLFAVLTMVVVSAVLFVFFRRKKWL
jgi:magnesium transporter